MLVWACPADVQVDVLRNCRHCVCDCMLCERTGYVPLTITGEAVGEVKNFKFLGTTISCDLKWAENISAAIKKTHQWLFFLRQLREFKVRASSHFSPLLGTAVCVQRTEIDWKG